MKLKQRIKQFNDYIADKLSYVLATMTMFYIISLLVIIPLLYSQPTSIVTWASYLCSVIFQGVALPVLGYTARKASDKSDKIIGHMNKTTDRIEHIITTIESQQEKIEHLVEMIEKQQEHISEDVESILNRDIKK